MEIELASKNLSSLRSEKESFKSFYFHNITSQQRKILLNLEGQCKIKQYEFLSINYFKGIVFIPLLILSIVGILLFKYYKKLRVMVLYTVIDTSEIDKITHIFIEGNDQLQEIQQVSSKQVGKSETKIFDYKGLFYQIHRYEPIPLGFQYQRQIQAQDMQQMTKCGLSEAQVNMRKQLFGKNQHLVESPNYFEYLFDTLTQPFFIFQYISSAIWILEGVAVFAVVMIVVSFVTTSINYLLLNHSYKKIKEIAQKKFRVEVKRGNKLMSIDNIELVPGDIFIPKNEIPCDAILVKGQLFVNQVSMTGQNVPIGKFELETTQKIDQKQHWIFEGSEVMSVKDHTLAIAVNIGYASQKGKIIRKILNKIPKQPQFFKKILFFMIQVLVLSYILFLATLNQLLKRDVETIMIVFRVFDFVTYSFPAAFPIFFNSAFTFCLIRLNKQQILSTEVEKTVQSSRLQTFCFDKTGTLTQNHVLLENIYAFEKFNEIRSITQNLKENLLIQALFACCHSVRLFDDNFRGDQIDLKMFQFTNAKIEQKSGQVLLEVEVGKNTYQVLKINQYESRFQSMSVIVRQPQQKKYFVFSKGSPELIHQYSSLKIEDYGNFIKNLSLNGMRSIAFSYKQISQSEFKNCVNEPRSQSLLKTTILGIVTFINKPKEGSIELINVLSNADIDSKIITGDNIYVGIQTATEIGIIKNHQNVLVLEGYKIGQNNQFKAPLLKIVENKIEEEIITVFIHDIDQVPCNVIAVDNNFIENPEFDRIIKKTKVFGRITPQNKAFIVKKHKNIIQEEYNSRTFMKRLTGPMKNKIAMIGDGANDLIAIKQADVGISLSQTSAVYSSNFTVDCLSKVQIIIKQSKNVERQIIEISQYYMLALFSSIMISILLTFDTSYFNSTQQIYKNFASVIPITLFFGLSSAHSEISRHSPSSNFMGFQNHLVYWSNNILNSVALLIGYVYYTSSDDFQENPKPYATFKDGWNGRNKSSTICFLMVLVIFSFLPISLYRSAPWKAKIYTNIILMITLTVNLILTIALYFTTSYLFRMGVYPIRFKQASIVFAIMVASCIISFIVNILIEKACLHQKDKVNSDEEKIHLKLNSQEH